jgi:hypothetical protein
VTDGTANVEIVPCGDALCGVLTKTDMPDQKDTNNSDPSKRDRPVLGITVLQNMKPQGDKWVGSVYNARNGMTYDAKISLHGEDILRVEGCLPGGVFCGGQNWSRVAQPTVAAAPVATAPKAPASAPAQQQAAVIPQEKQQTDPGLRPFDPVVPQTTSDGAAAAGRSAATLINQVLTKHDLVRGARIDPVQAAEAARLAAKMFNRYPR